MCVSCRFDDYGKEFPQKLLSVLVGAHNLKATEASQKRYKIKKSVLHQKYTKKSHQYDIMLLQLSSQIEYNKQTKPICVDASVFPYHTKCKVTGWGVTNRMGKTILFSGQLLLVAIMK